jgi:hypothetical protein
MFYLALVVPEKGDAGRAGVVDEVIVAASLEWCRLVGLVGDWRDVTEFDPRPSVGWRSDSSGSWTPPGGA